MAKYQHSSVATVAALAAAIGADLVLEGWSAHATVSGAWTSPTTAEGTYLSIYLYEDPTYGYLILQAFKHVLPSNSATLVSLAAYGVDFTASRNWTVYAYPEGVLVFDDTITTAYNEGFVGWGLVEPLDAAQAAVWNWGGIWALRSRTLNNTSRYSFLPGNHNPQDDSGMLVWSCNGALYGGLAPYACDGGTNTGGSPPGGFVGASDELFAVCRDTNIACKVSTGASIMGTWFYGNVLAVYPHADTLPSPGDTFTMDNGDVYEIPAHQSFAPTSALYYPFLALRTTEG